MILSLIISLVLTIIIELSISLILGIRTKDDIKIVLWVNIFTNPVVVYIANCLKLLNNDLIYNIVVLVLEILVVIIEFKLYDSFLNFDKKSPLLISAINNIMSFSLGIIISICIF